MRGYSVSGLNEIAAGFYAMKIFWVIILFLVYVGAWALSGHVAGILAVIAFICLIAFFSLRKAYTGPIEVPSEPVPMTKGMPLNMIAPVYDWYCAKVGLGKKFREKTLRLAGVKEGEKVLDVGCGTGVLTRMAASIVGQSGQAIGIDPAPKMIGVARKNASAEGSRSDFRLGVIEALPFPDDSFDCVLSSFMVHHLPPDVKLKGFKEALRVLRPGKRFIVVDIGRPSNPLWWAVAFPLLFWSFTKDQISGRLGDYFLKAGFTKVEHAGWWMGLFNFWTASKPGGS